MPTAAPERVVETACVTAGLNPAQLAAATHRGGHLLVAAGAGSGKTRTLAARVASLVADGVPPERLLLLTFTRRAAQDLVRRARHLTGDPRTRRVRGGTFHASAARVLRHHGRAVGLPPAFTVLDPGDVADLTGIVRAESGLGEGGGRFPKPDTLAAIASRVAVAVEPLSQVLEERFPWCREHEEGVRSILRATVSRKRALGVVDYDDLLLLWRALLTHDATKGLVAREFDHVLVDEYQDTNRVQADILAAYAEGGAVVTAVGDDAQAIYGFRAATVANIRGFQDRFASDVVVLEASYRSTPQVLDVANAVLDGMDGALRKRLTPTRPAGAVPRLVTCVDEADQAEAVCRGVLDARERGVQLREQAVLFRTSHHADGLELELARRDIPYVRFGGLKFLERAHVKDLRAVLRVLDNPGDDLAWDRVLRLLTGVGPGHARRLRSELVEGGATPDARLMAFVAGESGAVPAAAVADADALRRALAACLAVDGDGVVVPPASQLEALTPFFAHVWPARYPDPAPRLADLDQLVHLAARHATRTAFLTGLTLDPPESTSDLAQPPHLDDDWLTLSTIHSAKGMEWRAVHLLHAADGCIPSDLALRDKAGVEEERRLFYVAITRAKDELTITFPQRFHHDRTGHRDAHTWAQPSRFLTRLAPLLEHHARTGPSDAAPAFADGGTAVDGLLDDLFAG